MSEDQKEAMGVLGRQAAAYLLIQAQDHRLLRSAEQHSLMEQELRQSKDLLEQANIALLKLASTDALTGLANRRVIDEGLLQQPNASGDQRLSMLMIDVDRFKRISDTLSHETGDRVLQRVAEVLRSCTRDSDTVPLRRRRFRHPDARRQPCHCRLIFALHRKSARMDLRAA